ncbi:flagellar biosynthesis anti-sigma factor FlgM [Alloiococcus sp. CFN-8]|uniref:flagellar biosynthesis anti-sigma factor FlgM n=1 Tax=Alloiococcus sp. CFN-8 TaxID=3416081 RepID=UPI003CF1B925
MNIKGIGSNNIISLYSNVQKKQENVASEVKQDTIELSSIGRSLSSIDMQDFNVNNDIRVARIKEEISKGTYNIDAKLTAQGILDAIKGREFK